MTEEQRERIRLKILQQLHAVHPLGMTADDIFTGVQLGPFKCDRAQFDSELASLVELEFATVARASRLSTTRHYRRMESARELLQEKGLAE